MSLPERKREWVITVRKECPQGKRIKPQSMWREDKRQTERDVKWRNQHSHYSNMPEYEVSKWRYSITQTYMTRDRQTSAAFPNSWFKKSERQPKRAGRRVPNVSHVPWRRSGSWFATVLCIGVKLAGVRFHSRVDDRLRYWRFTNDSDMQHVRALPKSETEDHVSNGEFDGREGWLVGRCWS